MEGNRRVSAQRLGQALRACRRRAGLTQRALAARLGIGYQQVLRYEKGITQIPAVRLHTIAHVLDVPISHFYGSLSRPLHKVRDSLPTSSLEVPPVTSLEGAVRDLRALQALSPPVYRHVLALIKALREASRQES